MRILIIGTGNVGTAMASDLTLKGNEVIMLKTTTHLEIEHCETIVKEGIKFQDLEKTSVVNIKKVTLDYKEAFDFNPEVIVVAVQTNYHEEIIKNMSDYLKSEHILMFVPGYLSTAYVLKHCKNVPIVIEAESSPIDCRITNPGELTVIFKNARNPIGVYPKTKTQEILSKLKDWKYEYIATESVIESALHNPNLIVHTTGALMSIPRIEYTDGEYWMYKEVFTPSIWNLVEKLDNEKMEIMKALHISPIPYVEACKIRNSLDLNVDAKEVFFNYAQNSSPKGPNVSNSRYITEDVSQGLVMLESLGEVLNIKTTVCTALINIANACLNIDFRQNGRTVSKLGRENLERILTE